MKVMIRDRKTQQLFEEPLFSEKSMRFLFENTCGLWLSRNWLTKTAFSRLYGFLQSTAYSKNKIGEFTKRFKIKTDDFEQGPFASFNAFFYRKLKPGRRIFPETAFVMGACAEGRVLGFQKASECPLLNIKGKKVTMNDLIGGNGSADGDPKDGPVLIFRLSPVDYHRFHAMDQMSVEHMKIINGDLYTVHPVSWKTRPDVFFRNRRHIYQLRTQNFGPIQMIAVGGFCVGRIRESFTSPELARGDEVGWFEMGASTIILTGEPGAFQIDSDILESSRQMIESFTRLGEPVAVSNQIAGPTGALTSEN